MDIAAFQDDFAAALYGARPVRADVAAAAAQPAFDVYRNTIIKACTDNLAANFPTVLQLVGEEWFHGAAGAYARAAAPRSVSLFDYGDGFPLFIAQPAAEAGLPYLEGAARLDLLWIASHMAADEAVLSAGALGGYAPAQLGGLRLAVHAAARWITFDDVPAFAIWAAQREQRSYDNTLPWQGDGGLLTRPAGAVRWQPVGAGGAALLDACARGATLQQAAEQALAVQPALDIASTLAALMHAGAFHSFDDKP